ncbi:hypothetical protein EJ07DRAFT_163979 [Lizonia empirigonia]|nr:hypothetical protein EJ07DRAFT_163979 [Lizonia empirigonia]
MKRQRTKCFTGCWTCRSRRVKCDEETPSCQRCRQLGVACEGYGLRLNWVPYNPHDAADDDGDFQKPEFRGSRRSLTSLSTFPPVPCLPSPELDATLVTIDEWFPGDSSGLEEGAFGVFTAYSSLTQSSGTTRSPLRILPHPFGAALPGDPLDNHYTFSPTKTAGHSGDDPRETGGQSVNGSRGNSVPVVQPLQDLGRQGQPSMPRHLDALSMPSKQKQLIHHWITFTSRKLVLIDEPHNPCRTMMLPMALKGLISGSEDSNADVAIFHAICAAAAYNLFELTGRTNEQDRVLALYHDNEAVHHLRHNLAQADKHRDQSFAMAIMACIAMEAVSGTTQRWRTHVSGGLAYLTKLQTQGLDETALSALPRPRRPKIFPVRRPPIPSGLEFTFPYYGVSRSFLRAHDHINTLLTRGSRAPEKDLDASELQLYLAFPGLAPHPAPHALAPRICHGLVVQHTCRAFYYANLVFFQRSVRRAPVGAVQELVELGVQELEAIDRVGEGELGCLMLWPVLVLGAECDVPAVCGRMKEWFRAQRRLGFRNLTVLEDLVGTVWEARARVGADENLADWREVISQARFDVFRL